VVGPGVALPGPGAPDRELSMTGAALTVVWDPRLRAYDFGPDHPFREVGREFAVRLLERALEGEARARTQWERTVEPADVRTLSSFHTRAYLEVIRDAGANEERRPLDGGDTPAFPGCYEASARVVAATDRAVRLALEGRGVAFAPAGGLHHAHRDHASGFCIFNDVAVGISTALAAGRRLAYVDLDGHHGDGVMYGFYDDGRLLDIDFHQDGRTLFPGTGEVSETGRGDGAGCKVNLPLPPRSGDEAIVPLARRILPPLLREFRPGLVIVQHGVDGHWGDPLAQLQITPAGYAEVDRLLIGLADELGARLVVAGGGGYQAANVARVLARVGLLLAGARLPPDEALLPEDWRVEFFEEFGEAAPASWVDRPRLGGSPWGPTSEMRLVRSLEEALGRRFPAP